MGGKLPEGYPKEGGSIEFQGSEAQPSENQSLFLVSVVKGRDGREKDLMLERVVRLRALEVLPTCWTVEKGGSTPTILLLSQKEKQGPRIQSKVRCFRCFTWTWKSPQRSSLCLQKAGFKVQLPAAAASSKSCHTRSEEPPLIPHTSCLGDSRHSARV